MKNDPEAGAGIDSKIEAVILDYGLVIVKSPTREEFERLAEIFDVPVEQFFKLWEATRDVYDRGDLSPQEYWRKMAAELKRSVDDRQIEKLRKIEIDMWLNVDPAMLEWVKQLRAAGVKTAVLSNMPTDLATYLRENAAWLNDFTFKTFSGEVRMIKPDPKIYEYTLRGLGVAATNALFVDDRERNTLAAVKVGIRAIQFRDVAQLREELEEMNFAVLPVAAATEYGDKKISALL
jgi:putative hydrolase of the HAD superfamily